MKDFFNQIFKQETKRTLIVINILPKKLPQVHKWIIFDAHA